MDKNPGHKIYIFRLLVIGGSILLYLLGHAPPIQSNGKKLVSACSKEGHFMLKLQV